MGTRKMPAETKKRIEQLLGYGESVATIRSKIRVSETSIKAIRREMQEAKKQKEESES